VVLAQLHHRRQLAQTELVTQVRVHVLEHLASRAGGRPPRGSPPVGG
jgi:hypothetical protein